MVTGGKCLQKFMEMASTNCTQLKQSYWILIFGGIHFLLPQLPNFNSVAGVSLAAAAVMSLSYSTIAWVGCVARGQIDNVSYAYKKTSSADYMFYVFNALGQISFAFAGHAVPMWKGALGAYFINAICYFLVALIGYWAFGQDVDGNVLMNLKKPVYAIPVFDLLETMMVKKMNFPPGIALYSLLDLLIITLFIGVTFPFFGDLLGFFGGFGFAPTSYFLPSIMWLVIKKPKRFSASQMDHQLVVYVLQSCIFVGVFIMLASTIGGFRNIIADASTYSFYT
ncbi:hypothetical protein ACB092_08G000500 [Castanea dentata]